MPSDNGGNGYTYFWNSGSDKDFWLKIVAKTDYPDFTEYLLDMTKPDFRPLMVPKASRDKIVAHASRMRKAIYVWVEDTLFKQIEKDEKRLNKEGQDQ